MAVGEREQTEKIQNNTTMFSKLFVFCIVRPQINTSYAPPLRHSHATFICISYSRQNVIKCYPPCRGLCGKINFVKGIQD